MAQQEEYYEEEEVEYYEEDNEGWLWDEATQSWVEDPNWVDPNAEEYYYEEEATTDNTRNAYNDTQQTDAHHQQYNDSRHAAQNNAHSSTQHASSQNTGTTGGGTSNHRPLSGQQQQQQQSATSQRVTPSASGSGVTPAMLRRQEAQRAQENQNSSARIDERNIPRVNISNEIKTYNAKPNPDILPPSSREQYIANDCGNATPRYVRLTLNNIPVDMDIASKSQLAMGAIFQPFAPSGISEAPIPLVDCGPAGPIRCGNCRAYMNPHVLWFDSGAKWSCNLCHIVNQCPQSYRSNLDGKYQRRDRMQRHELHRGSVDYVAPNKMVEAWRPKEPAFFFVIDVSCIAYKRDLVTLTVQSILESLIELREQIRLEEEQQRLYDDDGKMDSEEVPPSKCVFSQCIHSLKDR